MIAKYILPALAAISSVGAQSATCTVSTTTITTQADATALAGCGTIAGSVVIDSESDTVIDLSGANTITGDLTAANNGRLITLKSSTLVTIGGEFGLLNATAVQLLDFSAISSVHTINWLGVPQLQTLQFGTSGITTCENLTISDSFLSELDGIALQTAGSVNINNNNRLVNIELALYNLTDVLIIEANGENVSVNLPNIVWAVGMSIANVSSFNAPNLQVMNSTLAFASNYFTSYNAPNLTGTTAGDISFVSNAYATNITFPKLQSIGGGLLIANNTALIDLDGFPVLEQVAGAVKLTGNFKNVEFPRLNVVKGAFDVVSTADIEPSCNALGKLAPSTQGGNNDIQGVFACNGNNSMANSDTGTNTTSTPSGGGSGSGGSGTKNNTAVGFTINHALLGVVAVGGFAQALW